MVSCVEAKKSAYINPEHFKDLKLIHYIRRVGYEPRLKPYYNPRELVHKLQGKTSEGWSLEFDRPVHIPKGKWRISKFIQRLVEYTHARVTGS